MKPEAQRIAIAEACGWKRDTTHHCWRSSTVTGMFNDIPSYLTDLNAMHEAEKVIPLALHDGWNGYWETLAEITKCGGTSGGEGGDPSWCYASMAHATSAQRAEAFLRTLGLWKEEV